MNEKYFRQFDEDTVLPFTLTDPDGIDFNESVTFAAGDVLIMRDEGVESQTSLGAGTPDLSTLITDEGTGYSIALDKADVAFKRIKIYFKDQTVPKVWLDDDLTVETTNNVAAQHPNINAPSGGGGVESFLASGETIIGSTGVAGSFTDTQNSGISILKLTRVASTLDYELLFNMTTDHNGISITMRMGLASGGQRKIDVDLFNYNTIGFDNVLTLNNNGGAIEEFTIAGKSDDFVDGNGDVRLRFVDNSLNDGDFINIDFVVTKTNSSTGTIPTPEEIAEATADKLAQEHGPASWEGPFIFNAQIESVTNQKTFVLETALGSDLSDGAAIVVIRDIDDLSVRSLHVIESYTDSTKTLVVRTNATFTVVNDDLVSLQESSISKKETRDAMALATAETPEVDSIDDKLDALGADLTIADNDGNKLVIAKAIKEFDATVIGLAGTSLLSEVLTNVQSSNLIQVNSLSTADGVTFNKIFQLMAAMLNGRFKTDTPIAGQTTYFERDDVTPLAIVSTDALERIRVL